MSYCNKVSSKYISAFSLAALLFALTVKSNDKNASYKAFHNYLTAFNDTIKPTIKKDTIKPPSISNKIDTSFSLSLPAQKLNDSIKKDTLIKDTVISDSTISDSTISFSGNDSTGFKISKDTLSAPINYNADDSMVFDVPSKKITLYGKKSKTTYADNELTAPIIELNQETGNITASIKRDSLGKVIAMPNFKQKDFSSQSDSIKFNMKTGKGITKSSYTQQGEMYVYGEVIKKINNDVFFTKRARFTTCDLDTPHFAFVSNKTKFINKKLAITGPVHPEFEGVPIPIYLPFGIFPLSQGRHSGIIRPDFTTNEQKGIGLEGFGYYKVLSDYWDVIFKGSLYSYGGWAANINPRYYRKYKYRGNISFDVLSSKFNFKGDPDFATSKSYHISWSHSQDTKSRPGVTFSANVNAGSSSYNSLVPNNPVQNFENSLNSSIAYSKTWRDKPFNLTISANHNQNTLQKLININLPDVAFNVSTIYPFRKKDFAGTPKWYENIGFAYNGSAKSLFSFYDTAKNVLQHVLDTFQFGVHHSVPITLSLPQLGIFQIAPSVSYDETWYQRKFVRSWDNAKQKIDTTITKGFYTARQMTFGLGVSTRIFGLIAAKDSNARIQAIRHEIRPTISVNYRPDFNKQNYYSTQTTTDSRLTQFSVFEGNVYSAYAPGAFGGINFGIDNNVQMKVKSKSDTSESGIKKISLIDGLSLNGSYNLIVDSFNFSNLNLAFRTNLFQKINITAGAIFDPYNVNNKGQRIKSLVWQTTPLSLGRLINGNVSVSSSFQGGNKNSPKQVNQSTISDDVLQQTGYTNDEYLSEQAYIRSNPAEYTDFSIPWSVNFSYALTFSRTFKSDYSGFQTIFSQNVNVGGSLGLTKKWQISTSGSYNISLQQLGLVTISISRDLHCWQMGMNITPVGRYRFFSINLSPKSSLLRDLKVNRTRSTYDAF